MKPESALEIIPHVPLRGEIEVPGSKSFTNRALLVAALAQGDSRLLRPLHSEDTRYMIEALRILGVSVSEAAAGDALAVSGCSGQFPVREADLYVGNAGTAMRFLAASLCLGEGCYRLDGDARMRERPIDDLIDALGQLGCRVTSQSGNGCPPLLLEARGLSGGECRISGARSSQFCSALLMAAPYARQSTTISVLGELVSKPYIDMTLQVMRDFGVSAKAKDYESFHVPCGQVYRGRSTAIEPDASNACYYWAAAAIAGGPVLVRGLSTDSSQGDVRFVQLLESMGCSVSHPPGGIEVTGGDLDGGDFDLTDMPDTAQTLAVVALFARGTTTLRGLKTLRIKETDRIAALAAELDRLGARVEQGSDFLRVTPAGLHGGRIQTYNDHRMAMSFALPGARVPGVVILNPACVAKTYPNYFEDIARIGLRSRAVEVTSS